MKDSKSKHLVKIILYIALAAVLTVCSVFCGLFQNVRSVFDGIHFDAAAFLQLIVMILLVMIAENLILLILKSLKPRSSRGATLLTLIQSIIKYLAIILAFCWGLTILGVDISTVVASVGVLALIIGFGAETLIADVVTGIFMLFEDQYNVGDIIEVNGFRGTVHSIGVRTTAVEDAGGNIKIINNSDMTGILNRSNHSSRSICEIGIPYETNLLSFEAQLPEMLEKIYAAHSDVFKAVPVYIGVNELAASSVVLKFTVEVDESNVYTGNRILNHDLLLAFRNAGVELPFNQLDVHTK